ncbi:hypothetical protein F4810DRAFT_551269 [Camillea tinctor]|nr:hypothetical protein F4810DRAFT_551269 [Camillea tinctor]
MHNTNVLRPTSSITIGTLSIPTLISLIIGLHLMRVGWQVTSPSHSGPIDLMYWSTSFIVSASVPSFRESSFFDMSFFFTWSAIDTVTWSFLNVPTAIKLGNLGWPRKLGKKEKSHREGLLQLKGCPIPKWELAVATIPTTAPNDLLHITLQYAPYAAVCPYHKKLNSKLLINEIYIYFAQ